jgi:hypothetical protein
VPAYPCAFEHAEFVAVVDLAPQRQHVIREGNDHDPGLSARRDLAGGGAQDRGACLLRAGHAGQAPVRPVAEWLCEQHGSLAASVCGRHEPEFQAEREPRVASRAGQVS